MGCGPPGAPSRAATRAEPRTSRAAGDAGDRSAVCRGREQVCDFRFVERVAFRLFLEPTVCAGQAMFVLAQVLGPGADEVGLDKLRGVIAIAEQFPPQGARPPPGSSDTP